MERQGELSRGEVIGLGEGVQVVRREQKQVGWRRRGGGGTLSTKER